MTTDCFKPCPFCGRDIAFYRNCHYLDEELHPTADPRKAIGLSVDCECGCVMIGDFELELLPHEDWVERIREKWNGRIAG